MKEYIAKEDLYNLKKYKFGVSLLSAEEHIKVSDIDNLLTVTKAEICREFVDKVDTELMTGYWDSVDCELIISREDLRDIVKRVLAEMENEG